MKYGSEPLADKSGGGGRPGRGAAAWKRTVRGFAAALPIMGGVLILTSVVLALAPERVFERLFTGGPLDPVIGAAAGSAAAGNPMTSYVLGAELLRHGVSVAAVSAFLAAWVTVGLVQLPAEALLLGRRFALVRNLLNFILAVLIGLFMAAVVGGG